MFRAIFRHLLLVLLHQTLRPRSRAADLRTILRTYGISVRKWNESLPGSAASSVRPVP